ncbi:MAG: tRNA (adenosine(37)-N6)-threonylcarbamoyltransferase complex transferase subunit TsaD [Sphingomonadales bacterium]
MTAVFLGIETSCDETAASIVGADKSVRSHVLASQVDLHQVYAGVVPEIAARAHVDTVSVLVEQALAEAGMTTKDLDGIAVTAGPGLIGGVMVGLLTAKAIAHVSALPYYAINHLEGHALSPRLVEDCPFPYLLLLISGGHCQILRVDGPGHYQRLSTTIDDAAGEAFDKLAKLLGLGYPGGPAVERLAKTGDAQRFDLPRPLKRKGEMNFSFSGLKTAALLSAQDLAVDGVVAEQDAADLCASFQAAITDSLIDRLEKAAAMMPEVKTCVTAGGVAANDVIRSTLEDMAARHAMTFKAPPLWLCTDNAAMIAWAGLEYYAQGRPGDALDFKAKARWPLDPGAAPAPGAGVKA